MGREQGNSAYASRDCKETTPAGNAVIATSNDHIQLAEDLSSPWVTGAASRWEGGHSWWESNDLQAAQHTGIPCVAGMHLNTREGQLLRREIPQPSRQHSPSNSLVFSPLINI